MAHDNPDSQQITVFHPDGSRVTELVQPTTACKPTISALPAETIYHILRFIDPQDLIRLQAASKLFREIITDPTVWRTIYATIPLPLPPGPFPWQSIHFHQRALVRSALLENEWTNEPLKIISKRIFTGPRAIENDRFRWIRGRWLIVSKDMKLLRSRDVDTGSEQVLWDNGSFSHWSAASVMNPVGHFMYVAVHLERGRLADPVKLLEFVVDDDTGHLSGPKTIDAPIWSLPKEAFVPRIRVDSGIAPYVYISLCSANKPRHSLVFDPQHRQFYKFPRFRTQLDLLLNYRGAWLPHLVEVYFTRTHLLVLNRSYLIHGNIGNVEIIQTFALPDPDVDPDPRLGSTRDPLSDGLADVSPIVRELRLTHEVVSRDTASMWLAPIRNTVVDPVTGATTLRFMHTYAPFQATPESRLRLACVDYILPAPQPGFSRNTAAVDHSHENSARNNDFNNSNLNAIVRNVDPVLPIIVESHDILVIKGVWNGNVLDTCADGYVRGLCVVGWYSGGSLAPNVGMVHKFAVDATGERCVSAVGDPCPPWEGLDPNRPNEFHLDAFRGRMWQTQGDVLERNRAGEPVDRDVLAIVRDFK